MSTAEELILFSDYEIYSSTDLARMIDPNNTKELEHTDTFIERQYDSDNFPHILKDTRMSECDFFEVPFIGINATNTQLVMCRFSNCQIKDSNFKFSDFSNSSIQLTATASSFDSSDFSFATINNSSFSGCSFSESLFFKARFFKSKILHSEFTGTTFRQCMIEEIDFSKSNIDYAEFEQIIFNKTVLPYWGCLHLTEGLSEILSNSNIFFSTPDGTHHVNKDKYIEEIHLLIPYLFQKKDYLALTNIYICDGETNKAYQAILLGIQNAFKNGNLNQINYFCRIASLNALFSREQMKMLYLKIENVVSQCSLTPMQYKKLLFELDCAKRLLIDCPLGQDRIDITLQTTIPHNNYQRISNTLKLIDTIVSMNNGEAIVSHTELRHNSPVEITIQVAGWLGNLLAIYALLDFFFDKSSTYVERVQNIILNHKKISGEQNEETSDLQHVCEKLKNLEQQIKEVEQNQHKQDQNKSPIILPGTEDFQRISYTISTKSNIPETLRAYSASKE